MNDTLREYSFPMVGSAVLHATMLVALALVARMTFHRSAPASPGPSIDAVTVDSQLLLNAQQAKARKAAQAMEQERQREEEQQRLLAQQQAEVQHREDQARAAMQQKQAAQRAADLQATARKAKQLAAQQAAAARAEAAEKQRADAARAAAEQKAAAARAEGELRRQMAEEERLSALQSGPQQASYIAAIQNRITRAWLRPASARPGIVCTIQVTQIPGGEVTSAHVTDCNGDEAVRQSVENAVYRASPLPMPPDPALFQRNLTLVFKPNE
jgi:colicin import membrane protein